MKRFTLTELLVVVTIILILVAIATPAMAPLMRSRRIDKAVSTVIATVREARFLAATGRPMKLRFSTIDSRIYITDLRFNKPVRYQQLPQGIQWSQLPLGSNLILNAGGTLNVASTGGFMGRIGVTDGNEERVVLVLFSGMCEEE